MSGIVRLCLSLSLQSRLHRLDMIYSDCCAVSSCESCICTLPPDLCIARIPEMLF